MIGQSRMFRTAKKQKQLLPTLLKRQLSENQLQCSFHPLAVSHKVLRTQANEQRVI